VDFAAFAQDRIQPSKRWYIEFAARVDRDGVAEDVSASPRTGAAVLLNTSGSAVLRAGYGLFYERTPSVAGAFQSFETATDSRYADDGVASSVADGDRPRGRRPAVGAAMWDVATIIA
jgi:hypothetical protein